MIPASCGLQTIPCGWRFASVLISTSGDFMNFALQNLVAELWLANRGQLKNLLRQ
jgi:hypothetical protein